MRHPDKPAAPGTMTNRGSAPGSVLAARQLPLTHPAPWTPAWGWRHVSYFASRREFSETEKPARGTLGDSEANDAFLAVTRAFPHRNT